MKNIFSKYIATIFAILIIVIHFIPPYPLNFLAVFGFLPFSFLYSGNVNPLIIQTIAHTVLFLVLGMVYIRKIRLDKLNNEFLLIQLFLYYFFLLFSIHQLYFLTSIFISGDYRYDANDFIGVLFTSHKSCFIFLFFGLLIDSIKNSKGVPQIKFY